MKYMLLTYLDENAWRDLRPDEQQKVMDDCDVYVQDLIHRGKFLAGSPLEHTSLGKTVRVRSGNPVITDGPFAETKEQVGGYTLIEADSLDEAAEIAAGFLSRSTFPGNIEVRPLVNLPGTPAVPGSERAS